MTGAVESIAGLVAKLTPQQRRVVELLACGRSNAGAARALGLSAHTVKFHVAGACKVTGATCARHLVAMAAIAGAVSPTAVAAARMDPTGP